MSEISRRPWNRSKPRIGMYQSRLHWYGNQTERDDASPRAVRCRGSAPRWLRKRKQNTCSCVPALTVLLRNCTYRLFQLYGMAVYRERWEEAVTAYSKIPCRYLPGTTEENHKDSHSRQPGPGKTTAECKSCHCCQSSFRRYFLLVWKKVPRRKG